MKIPNQVEIIDPDPYTDTLTKLVVLIDFEDPTAASLSDEDKTFISSLYDKQAKSTADPLTIDEKKRLDECWSKTTSSGELV